MNSTSSDQRRQLADTARAKCRQAADLLAEPQETWQVVLIAEYLQATRDAIAVCTFLGNHSDDSMEETSPPDLVVEAAPTAEVHEPSDITSDESLAEQVPFHGPSTITSLAESLSTLPIQALQASLSINDRVRFAASLVEGNMDQFMALCAEVDGAIDFESAFKGAQRACSEGLDWEEETGVAFEFRQLIHRRFS